MDRGNGIHFGTREMAGAVADIGVLLPIAVALIVANGLSATAVLLPAGLLYVTVALVYGLPIPVQPLKAFGAIAIAKGLGSDEIAAGALLMGVIFLVLGRTGLIDLAARAFPKPLIRGVQITVGLLFLKIAWGLVSDPPSSFDDPGLTTAAATGLALVGLALLIVLRKAAISLVLVGVGAILMLVQAGGELTFGPSALTLPDFDADVLLTALTVLVIPQLPLSFANSCLATADAARTYFGERAGARPAGPVGDLARLGEHRRRSDQRDAGVPWRRWADRPSRVRRAHGRRTACDRRSAGGPGRHSRERAGGGADGVPAAGPRVPARRRRAAAHRPRARPAGRARDLARAARGRLGLLGEPRARPGRRARGLVAGSRGD